MDIVVLADEFHDAVQSDLVFFVVIGGNQPGDFQKNAVQQLKAHFYRSVDPQRDNTTLTRQRHDVPTGLRQIRGERCILPSSTLSLNVVAGDCRSCLGARSGVHPGCVILNTQTCTLTFALKVKSRFAYPQMDLWTVVHMIHERIES